MRRSLRLAREHAVDGGLAGLLILLPVSLLSAFLDRGSVAGEMTFGAMGTSPGASALDLLQALVFTPWAFAAVFLLMVGQAGRLDEAVTGGLRRLLRTVGAGVLAGVACALPFIPAVVVFVAGGGPELMSDLARDVAADGQFVWLGGPPDFLLGALGLMLLGVPVSVYLALRLGPTVPLAVADDMSPVRALRASWSRMVGQRVRLFGGMLALILLALVLMLFVSIPTGLFILALGPEGGWVPAAVVNSVFGAVFTLLTAGLYAVIRADSAPVESVVPHMGEPPPAAEPLE